MTTYLRTCRFRTAWLAKVCALCALFVGYAANCHKGIAQEIGRFPTAALRGELNEPRLQSAPANRSRANDDVALHNVDNILAPGEEPPPVWSDEHPQSPTQSFNPKSSPGHCSNCGRGVCGPGACGPGCCGPFGRHGVFGGPPPDCFTHNDPDDPLRHIGLGQPLVGTSWLNRPCSATLMFGGMMADDSGIIELNNGYVASVHLGYDFDHYFGGEVRMSGGQVGVTDLWNVSDDLFMLDIRMLHYPWGDSLWRPYYSIGIGTAQHSLADPFGVEYSETLINIPLGIGLKYLWKRNCAMRFDVTHNLNVGSGAFSTMDNVSITAGAEWRFGGTPTSYFPWSASNVHD